MLDSGQIPPQESQNFSRGEVELSAEEEGLYLTQSFQPPNEADPYFTDGETEAKEGLENVRSHTAT